jgi:hypothetical protein
LYQDIDGQAPTYRGRVLMELGMEEETKEARMTSKQCPAASGVSHPSIADSFFKRFDALTNELTINLSSREIVTTITKLSI